MIVTPELNLERTRPFSGISSHAHRVVTCGRENVAMAQRDCRLRVSICQAQAHVQRTNNGDRSGIDTWTVGQEQGTNLVQNRHAIS